MKGLYEDIIPCWLILALSSILSPSDMCHSLIGWEKAQSMCFSLIQSEPFLSLPPSFHPDRRSSNPSAYKLNPLPSLFHTIHFSTLIMPLCHPNPSWVKSLLPFPSHNLPSPFEACFKHLSTHIKSDWIDEATNKRVLRWESPFNGSHSHSKAHL